MVKKLVLAYSFLVGLPLLVVLGTLQAGRRLAGPPAISGDWTVNDPAAWSICAKTAAATPALFSISQSGADLEIALNDRDRTIIAGRLEGSRFSTRGSSAESIVRMEGNVAGSRGRRSLVGWVSFSGGAPCGLTLVRAQ